MAKLDIDFVLLDESAVRYGFRALMSGAQLDDFKKNPVMLLQHNRTKEWGGKDDVMLPIGRWYDIRVEGTELLAKPDFDDDDELAIRIQKKVEKKYLNAVSVWIDPIATSDDTVLMVPGQTLPTMTKWGILEASIVDIPNCRNSLAIRNSVGNKIQLSGENDTEIKDYLNNFLINKKSTMDKKLLTQKLGLDENAADIIVSDKLTAILNDAIKLAAVQTENTALKDEVIKLKNDAAAAKIADLVDGAIAAKKIGEGDKEKYTKLATADYATTKELIDGMKGYVGVQNQLSANTVTAQSDTAELNELLKLSGNDLYMQGKLERLQALSEPHFKLKYKEAFNVEYPTV